MVYGRRAQRARDKEALVPRVPRVPKASNDPLPAGGLCLCAGGLFGGSFFVGRGGTVLTVVGGVNTGTSIPMHTHREKSQTSTAEPLVRYAERKKRLGFSLRPSAE